jgi:hypothetical protein
MRILTPHHAGGILRLWGRGRMAAPKGIGEIAKPVRPGAPPGPPLGERRSVQ